MIFDLLEHEGPLPRRLLGHQRRGRDPARQGAWPRQDHRHGARRQRHALSVEAVQPGIPALEEAAGPGLDREEAGHRIPFEKLGDLAYSGARSERLADRRLAARNDRRHSQWHAHRLPVPRGFLSEGLRGEGRRRHARRRHRARPHGVLRGLRRPARRQRHADRPNPERRFRSPMWCSPTRARPRSRMCRAPGSPAFAVGDTVTAAIDWPIRHARMRMHTALHLLSAVLPYPVTGGSIGEAESRLDFDIPEAGLDKDAITAKLAEMIAAERRGHQPLDHRRRARSQSGPGQDHVGQAADGHRPGAADRDRGPRPAALRRHPCARHGRDRGRARHPGREEGQAEPPGADRAGLV